MRQIFIIALITLVFRGEIAAQKNINLIISVDESIVQALPSFTLIIISRSGERQIVNANYSPGRLLLKESDYSKLLDSSVVTVDLSFIYNEYTAESIKPYTYSINLNKDWFKQDYFLLYVYNTNKKKYKGIYKPIKGKNYVYEYDYPGLGVRRIRQKK